MAASATVVSGNSPLHTKSIAASIDGVPTDFVTIEFRDRFLVLITQFQKIGSLATIEHDMSGDGNHVFSSTGLLGRRDDPMTDLCGRHLGATIAETSDKPVLLSLSLRNSDTVTLRAVLKVLERDDIRLW
jgi:hypothetical protein